MNFHKYMVIPTTCMMGMSVLTPLYAQDVKKPDPEFIGSEECSTCHESETNSWKKSHHDLAWTPPNKDHVLGDFNNNSFTHKGVTTTFTTEGDTYFIESDGPSDKITRYEVKGVIGVEPLQQYLIETEPGKLQSFDVVWDVDKKLWFHLYPDQDLDAKNGLHWTGPYKNWNARCAECHSTGFEKNYDSETFGYQSKQAEIGVGCETCHGPGEAHKKWAKVPKEFDASKWAGSLLPNGLTFDFNTENAEQVVQQCGTCHSRREPFTDKSVPAGTNFHNAYQLNLLREGLYHSDGQIQNEVYVMGSFMQSKMYDKGVSCTNCHDPHAANLITEGNAICTQCHSKAGNTKFDTLTLKNYDDPSHHFHEQDSKGAECKSCHMIERVYMGNDGRRDHSFRVPRPDLTVKIDTPNACNDCHDDKTAAWAAEAVEKWYPNSTFRGPHFGEVLDKARKTFSGNVDDLLGIAAHKELPAIVRASALDMLMRVSNQKIADDTAGYLTDESPLVRAAAVSAQRGASEIDKIKRLAPMTDDPIRSVRVAAAKEMLDLFVVQPKSTLSKSLLKAMNDWRGSLTAKTDFPEVQLTMGGMALRASSLQAALNAFTEAVRQDPQLVDAWIMIVRIEVAAGNMDGAKLAIQNAISSNPNAESLQRMKQQLETAQ